MAGSTVSGETPVPRETLVAAGWTIAEAEFRPGWRWGKYGSHEYSIDLARGIAARWGELPSPRPWSEWPPADEVPGKTPRTLASPLESDTPPAPVSSPAAATGRSPEDFGRTDLRPFVRHCLAAGFRLDAQERTPRPDPAGTGNILLRWTDGSLFLALPWTQTLVGTDFRPRTLGDFAVTTLPPAPPLDPAPRRQRELFA